MQINPELVQEIKYVLLEVAKLSERLKNALERKSAPSHYTANRSGSSSLSDWEMTSLLDHRKRIHNVNHLIESLDKLSVAEVEQEVQEEEEPPPDEEEQFKLQALEAIRALQDEKQIVMQQRSTAKAKQKVLTQKQIDLYLTIGVDKLTSRERASLTKHQSTIADD